MQMTIKDFEEIINRAVWTRAHMGGKDKIGLNSFGIIQPNIFDKDIELLYYNRRTSMERVKNMAFVYSTIQDLKECLYTIKGLLDQQVITEELIFSMTSVYNGTKTSRTVDITCYAVRSGEEVEFTLTDRGE
jgi:hypothetical protein